MIHAHMGCGDDVKPGYINFDRVPFDDRVEQLDLEQVPYHIFDDSFDTVECRHVLEHLDRNPYEVLREFHRITKPGGMVVIELPIFGNLVSHNRFLHSRNYLAPVYNRRSGNAYIDNLFTLKSFKKKQRCSFSKILWKMKTRFFTWVDSFLYDSYEWMLEVNK